MAETLNVPEIFGSDVFNEAIMKQRLPVEVYRAWENCIQTGSTLPLDVANEIAEAMKIWALEKGATHYTHWFQPMTGITAEKHDSFISPGVLRQGAGPGRTGCLLIPLGRSAGNLRGPRLHRLGPHGLRLCQGRQPVYSHHVFLLYR